MPGEKPAQVLSIDSSGSVPEIYIAPPEGGNEGD
jgi:hypothetical protein